MPCTSFRATQPEPFWGCIGASKNAFQGYFEAFRTILPGYGVPDARYADRLGVYCVNTKKPEHWSVKEQLAGNLLDTTQFGHIVDLLGRELIPVGSLQAKGCIERLRETPQSRLIQSFRFHRQPACLADTVFAPLPVGFDLDTLLAAKYKRTTDNRILDNRILLPEQ